jgi:hypothetical protein
MVGGEVFVVVVDDVVVVVDDVLLVCRPLLHRT